ncbi:Cytochrome P450 2U1 [Orchesella cincta]|uniref:Cytochrome P450 2U1 n=1 Tax=Orchesella cincta TaxID=48709 RepID=A0A1D2MPW7_ORCCI|nr:Cytochrome P450 2U1 [Orchesella cincta]
MDMFQNAVDTVGSTLTFLVLYSILNREAKKKVQEEIERFSIEDFKCRPFNDCHLMLPYTSAFIMETMRFSCALPMIAPRVATQDIHLDDFHIKAGTSLLVNLRALNSSKEAWNDPEKFRPERFLEPSSGQLDNSKTRLMLSFGAGKRVCPSQKFAEQILLIFFVNLMKTYDFLPAPDAPLPTITKWFGLSYSPKPFYTQVKGRHKLG